MISFFAKPVYYLDDPNGGVYPQRLSSIIRGKQLADYLGAKFNPTDGYDNDVCIYIKPTNLNRVKDGDYVDVLDNPDLAEKMKTRPGVKVIAMSGPHYDWLKSFLPNEIVHIPHCHFNYENIRRDRKQVTTCGYVGARSPYHTQVNEEIKKRLAEVGLDYIAYFNFDGRQDNIDFYKKIDIQIIGYFGYHADVPYYHQTKIVNAMSFGIPTIAGYKLGYKDVEGFYSMVDNLDELVKEAERMKDLEYYNQWPEKIIKEAEKYHIKNITDLYKKL